MQNYRLAEQTVFIPDCLVTILDSGFCILDCVMFHVLAGLPRGVPRIRSQAAIWALLLVLGIYVYTLRTRRHVLEQQARNYVYNTDYSINSETCATKHEINTTYHSLNRLHRL